ncbi:hypothetical protein B9Z19DRAFT_1132483 [Tuber borchii]|uniref:Uncharacterized protein n=1 Tax=Tuber borchii TaxID=42251 RepID=A0A2T6ZH79_TUBBO|nr:hypothetical protein B9Z19DRAFT_1132483 [Tuber borchii]
MTASTRTFSWVEHQENVKTRPSLPGGVTVPLVLPGPRWSALVRVRAPRLREVDQGGSAQTRKDHGDQKPPWSFRRVQDHPGPCKNIFLMRVYYGLGWILWGYEV